MKRRTELLLSIPVAALVIVVAMFALFQSLTGIGSDRAVANLRAQLMATESETPLRPQLLAESNKSAPPKVHASDTDVDWPTILARSSEAIEREEGLQMLVSKRPTQWTADEREEVNAFLAKHQNLIQTIREMTAYSLPTYSFDPKQMREELRPQVNSISDAIGCCTILLRLDAKNSVDKNDHIVAAEDILAAMRLASVLDEPAIHFQIGGTWGKNAYRVITGDFKALVDMRKLSPELANSLLRELEVARDRRGSLAQLKANIAVELDRFAKRNPEPDDIKWRLYLSPLGQPFVNMDKQAFASEVTETLEFAELPHYQAQPQREQIRRKRQAQSKIKTYSRPFSRKARWWHSFSSRQSDYEGKLDLTRLALMLEQYYVRHGQYPDSLDVFTEQWGGIPIDPLNGKPYQYEHSQDNYRVYQSNYDGYHVPRWNREHSDQTREATVYE